MAPLSQVPEQDQLPLGKYNNEGFIN